MKSISREDYGYFDAPPSDEELREREEKKMEKEDRDEINSCFGEADWWK